jgi:hypothetical protein
MFQLCALPHVLLPEKILKSSSLQQPREIAQQVLAMMVRLTSAKQGLRGLRQRFLLGLN